jgi:hypothetical protein
MDDRSYWAGLWTGAALGALAGMVGLSALALRARRPRW